MKISMNWMSLLIVVVFFSTACSSATFGDDEVSPQRQYYASQAEADARFEKKLAELKDNNGERPAYIADISNEGGTSVSQSKRIAEIKKSWEKSFNAKGLIKFGDKPPPPPNTLFKKAERGNGFVVKKKKSNNKRKGKSKKGKRR